MNESQDSIQAVVQLKKGREKALQKRHPWLFSGAIAEVQGEPTAGEVVAVCDGRGTILGRGFFNPHSQIRVRLLSFGEAPVDRDFFRQRLQRAIAFRRQVVQASNACRLVHGEADGLPGLIVDQYDRALVIQFSALGMAQQRDLLVELLRELLQPELIVERSEGASLKEEGLSSRREVLWPVQNATQDAAVSVQVEIEEHGALFGVHLLAGQKTGFFLDQRDNRLMMAEWVAAKARIEGEQPHLLNCFSYTGGFSVQAARKGIRTTSVEISEPAQEQARDNFRRNGLNLDEHEFVTANVFDYLRTAPADFDAIILDPPAFVKNRKHLQKACRAYQDINRLAMKLSRPDGLLLSCSCSHYLDWDLFQKVLFAAALEAGREVQILQRLGHAPDHPVSLFHPEGEYLKAFLLRVV